jgi:hypothetical protein
VTSRFTSVIKFSLVGNLPKHLRFLNKQYPYGIGPAGRWYIFSGIPVAIIALFHTTVEQSLDQLFGEKISPYLDLFIIALIAISALVLYDYFPKRLVIPLGIAGWIISLSLLYWYFWFGPGAFGHHHRFN